VGWKAETARAPSLARMAQRGAVRMRTLSTGHWAAVAPQAELQRVQGCNEALTKPRCDDTPELQIGRSLTAQLVLYLACFAAWRAPAHQGV